MTEEKRPLSDRTGRLSEKAVQLAHDFLSALFMGVRTAQIHDASNVAFTNAVNRVGESATALFSATGGFDVQIVDETFFVNGVQLRFQGKTFESMRTLRRILESQEMGGFRMRNPPTFEAVRRLISLFATGARGTLESHRQLLASFDIGVLGVQQLSDGQGPVKLDRRVFAVHSYAKLILALREQGALIQHARVHGPDERHRPRIRVVRVIQDLAELCDERLDLLLRLASNTSGAPTPELAAANACVLALAMGHALDLHRRDLGDIGMAALFTQLGRHCVPEPGRTEALYNAGGLARLLAESGVGQGLYTRAMVLSEQVYRASSSVEGLRRAHPFSRLVRVASAYAKLVTGLDMPQNQPLRPVAALRALRADRSGWLDPRFVDLLVNLLRAFPQGTPVVLSTGHHAVVAENAQMRWDRPKVRVATQPPATYDLERGDGGMQVVMTQNFLGAEPPKAAVVPDSSGASAPAPAKDDSGLEMIPAERPKAFRPPTRQAPMPSLSDLARQSGPGHSAPQRVATAPQIVDTRTTQDGLTPIDPWVSRSYAGHPGLPPPPAAPSGADRSPAPAPTSDPTIPVPTGEFDDVMANVPLPTPPGGRAPPAAEPGHSDLAADLMGEFDAPPAGAVAPPTAARSSPPDDDAVPILDPILGFDSQSPEEGGAFSEDAANRLIGTYLAGKYRILEKIGEGGMGAVFIANQEPIDRKVAVKVLLSSLAGDEVAVKRFEREAKTISRMRHPNTVTIYDFGKTAANELYIVMEYLDGFTLADVLRDRGAVAPDRAARIIRQACASLSEAHEAGIIHRDLKPDNIFLTRLGNERDWVKVLDFGLAKLADNETTSRLTQRGKVFGTPRYMSPEQAQGLRLDARSDLYTLGVVLYELLTGTSPFDAGNMVALLVKHISEAPPPLSQTRPDLKFDPRLEQVVLRALAKKPEDRFADVDAFAEALEPFAYPNAPKPRAPSAVPARFPPLPVEADLDAGAPEEPKGELDALLSDFLSELTPLEHLAEDSVNPFEGYTPGVADDDDPLKDV